MKRIALLLVGLFAFAGCAEGNRTTEETSRMPVGAGESFVSIGNSYEKIWGAATQALSPEFTIVSSNRYSGEIKARKPATKGAREELIGIYVAPLKTRSGNGYRVKVSTLKGAPGKGKNWEEILMERMQGKLG